MAWKEEGSNSNADVVVNIEYERKTPYCVDALAYSDIGRNSIKGQKQRKMVLGINISPAGRNLYAGDPKQ